MAVVRPIRLGIAADTLLERALDRLHAELVSEVEVETIYWTEKASGQIVPTFELRYDETLRDCSELVELIIDIEDRLGMPESFATAHSPRWLREVIKQGRALRDQAS